MTKMEQRIIQALRSQKRGIPPKDLSKKLSVRKNQREEYRATLLSMLEESAVMEYKGRYYLPQNLELIRGEIVKVNGTFGFAKNLETEGELFIPGRDLNGALPGDIVLLKQFKGTGQLPEGKVFQVVSEAEHSFSGVVQTQDDRLVVVPDKYVRFPVSLYKGKTGNAKPGDKVLARIVKRGRRHSEHLAEIVECFGSAENAAACCRAVLAAAGIRTEFPPEALEQAAAIAAGSGIHPKELAVRTDLRDQPIFTIDSADSKDLDDAVSLRRRENGWELGVHIADVSYYVTHRSPLDLEAMERGTSVYYADSVIPMLPEALSNGICSLNPGEDRLTFSALMELDENGKLLEYRFAKTVIRSRVKGVYSEVNAILAGTAEEALLQKYSGLTGTIREMKELSDRMTMGRHSRGGFDLDSVESKIVLDETGHAVDVCPRQRGDSERVIEEFMLTANEAAATFALNKGLPFVFRVHESPAPDRLQELAQVLDKLGISYKGIGKEISGQQISQLLDQVRGGELAGIINTMVLRSMAKAKYSQQNIGHFGLALQNYTHFTSPIRRYPDLTIHRILSGLVTGMKGENIHKRFTEFAAQSALQSTQREITAMTAERDCEDCYKAEYMQRFVGEELEGVIASVTAFGVYVQLPNTVEGLLGQRDFPAGDWSYDGSISFTDGITGRSLRLGDRIRVRVAGVDVSAGQVDFVPGG